MYNDPVMVRPQTPHEGGGRRRVPWRMILVGVAILFALGIGIYFYIQSRSASGPQQTTAEEASRIVKEVEKLMLLPEGETPPVATVTDPAKLSDQSFFVNATQGDKVLIYAASQKIILYNPRQNKIINVAVLSSE